MTHNIQIQFFAFDPPSLTINPGDSLQWTNADGAEHTATRTDTPAFDTDLLAEGETSEPISFPDISPAEGWRYICTPHPHMVGTIIVAAASDREAGGAGDR